MIQSKVCLSLTGSTIKENLEVIEKYRDWIDVVELRADYLNKDERLSLRRFPELAGLPCILSIRRSINGGKFDEGEATRTVLFARAIAFANQDTTKNYAYIDLESDFNVPALLDASLAFGTKIIRTVYCEDDSMKEIHTQISSIRKNEYEIPKIAFTARSLSDVTKLFREVKKSEKKRVIFEVAGPYSQPERILSSLANSYFVYTSDSNPIIPCSRNYSIDPKQLQQIFHFDDINEKTKIYAFAGKALSAQMYAKAQNKHFRDNNMNAVCLPVYADKIEEVLEFADELSIPALSFSFPFNKSALQFAVTVSSAVGNTERTNTFVKTEDNWIGFNTSVKALLNSLLKLTGKKNLFGWRVSIIGAGSMARTAAYVVKLLRGKACIFNRTVAKAKELASLYNFKWASLSVDSQLYIEDFSDLIIQTTSVGSTEYYAMVPNGIGDPIPNYIFRGNEKVFDCVASNERTPVIMRAEEAGCTVMTGEKMMEEQIYMQYKLFTGEYDD